MLRGRGRALVAMIQKPVSFQQGCLMMTLLKDKSSVLFLLRYLALFGLQHGLYVSMDLPSSEFGRPVDCDVFYRYRVAFNGRF
jgi:hypothetical protein